MGGTKMQTVDMSLPMEKEETSTISPRAKRSNQRSKKYKKSKSYVDRTKTYNLDKAIELLLKTSYTTFTGTISLDAIVKDKNLNLETTFPHATGKTIRVAIASEAIIEQIEAGTIDFDVLIAQPKMMVKLAKHARVLGPKGLMPNPKNKTVTDDPEARKKELEKGVTNIKTEKKAPLTHTVVGKTSMKPEELQANIEHFIKVVGPRKLLKLTLSATMSPGIKIDLTPYQTA